MTGGNDLTHNGENKRINALHWEVSGHVGLAMLLWK